jgi:hypothetical protein
MCSAEPIRRADVIKIVIGYESATFNIRSSTKNDGKQQPNQNSMHEPCTIKVICHCCDKRIVSVNPLVAGRQPPTFTARFDSSIFR